jgi:hypothetical protein
VNYEQGRKLDYHLTNNSAQEDADYAFETAMEALRVALVKAGNDPDKLADLLISVMGSEGAATVLLDFLEGDSDALNEAVIGWAL